MAKTNSQKPPKQKKFQSVPFDRLRGMVVPNVAPVPLETPFVQKLAEPAETGLELFMRAVDDVMPISKQNKNETSKYSGAFSKIKAETINRISPDEELGGNLFLAEISRLKLNTKFEDSAPDDGEIKTLSGNRLRQVKLGVVSVDYQLDLHGLKREEALAALPGFLRSAQQKGQKAVLIITGKGNHSAEEPVLHRAIASWLSEAGRELLVEFAPAPREMGGNGAFVVFLRAVLPKIKSV